MNHFLPFAAPKTPLGVYRILSPKAGVRVSPLALGAMSIGEAWASDMGSMNKEQSFKLLDAFYEAGGNFIDTACNYQNDESEEWIGEWMEKRGIRDEMIIATKYTTNYRSYKYRETGQIAVNFGGNTKKSLHVSLRDSLKKLRTDYVDILYLHWWDHTTSIEEIMHSLDAVVKSGKVLYLGVSDTPAWIVSSANRYARDKGLSPFVIYQGLWNVMMRDFEHEIIPMVRHEGMALAPWGAMGQGLFQSKKQVEERKANKERLRKFFQTGQQSEQEAKVSAALEKVAKEVGEGVSLTAVALAYVLQKVPYVFPIVGGRKVEYLKDNIKALEITLSKEQIEYLESQTPLVPTFPGVFVGKDPHVEGGDSSFVGLTVAGAVRFIKDAEAIPGAPVPSQ